MVADKSKVTAINLSNGELLWSQTLPSAPVPWGMAVDRNGRVILNDADESMALLPVGQSEQPESSYRLSGYDLWSKGKLRPAPLSRKKVEKLVKSRKSL